MDNPAVSPELLVTLTAALENLRTACRLPSGWKAVPSFRLTEKGASLLVVWRPTPASVAPRTKNNRRSPSSRQRSADRAAAHKTRKGQQSAPPQQQLRRSAPVFNMPIPPTPNPVPAAGQPAAEESERVGGRMEVALQKRPRVEGSEPNPSSQAAGSRAGPSPMAENKSEWQRLVGESGQLLVEAWERGDQGHVLFASECRTLDSLAGDGFAQRLIHDCELRARRSDGG